MSWTTTDIPPQQGRTAIITGTGGLGYEVAAALAAAGAEVVLAGRDPAKGAAAIARIRQSTPHAQIDFALLDLARLASIAAFADRMLARRTQLDLLVNNAGIMALPSRRETEDGFELQLGTNYLGHFALTGRLLPLLRRGRNARVVQVSSLAHRSGAIRFDDMQWTRGYRPWAAYGQSKLAMLIFALELQRRSFAQGWGLTSNAAHPGFARTELIRNGRGEGSILARMSAAFLQPIFSQSAAAGALPILYAGTSPAAAGGGGYYGPEGLYEMKGPVAPARVMSQATNPTTATRLWSESERLTNVRYG
jgi:NAD(P)-dependent dehydrogenase (short-subunit alcohol dehydrogenase family)